MDDQVLRAMQRWPDVPAVHGWLRLDRRGRWLLIDRGRPDFDPVRDGAGSLITSPPILDFIGRNYTADDRGAWFWQNGPQRVFVDLELAPLVLRVLGESPAQCFVTQTGWLVERIDTVASDADGNLWLRTEHGPALVDDRDIAQLVLDVDESGDDPAWTLTVGVTARPVVALPIAGAAALGAHLGFRPRPRD